MLNYEDEVLRAFGEKIHTRVLDFSSQRKLEKGIYLEGGSIVCSIDGTPEAVCHICLLYTSPLESRISPGISIFSDSVNIRG